MIYAFIEAEKANFPVAFMCRTLQVSPSGFYEWRGRPASVRAIADGQLTETIAECHRRSRGTYGSPRIHADLREDHGIRCGRKRVARLMRAAGLVGVHRRGPQGCTKRAETPEEAADDLVGRRFQADAPPTVGRGRHPAALLGRLAVCRGGHRRVHPHGRGMGHGRPSPR